MRCTAGVNGPYVHKRDSKRHKPVIRHKSDRYFFIFNIDVDRHLCVYHICHTSFYHIFVVVLTWPATIKYKLNTPANSFFELRWLPLLETIIQQKVMLTAEDPLWVPFQRALGVPGTSAWPPSACSRV